MGGFFETFRQIDDAGLDVYQYRLLMHIFRVGKSWESYRTLAKKCHMSVSKTHEVKKWLLENDWLKSVEHMGRVAVVVNMQSIPDMEVDGQTPASIWSFSKLKSALLDGLNGNRCVYCGSEEVKSFDHWIPLARGGDDDDGNLVPSCNICNQAKGALTGPDFIELLLARSWLLDDRSQGEQIQQLSIRKRSRDEQTVRHKNGSFAGRTNRSQEERHLKDPTLRKEKDPPFTPPQPEPTFNDPPSNPAEAFPFEPSPVTPATLSPADLRVQAILDVCGLDGDVPEHKKAANKAAASLRKYTADFIRNRYGSKGWWYQNDWRGIRGDQPTPDWVVETIAKRARAPAKQNSNGHMGLTNEPVGLVKETGKYGGAF